MRPWLLSKKSSTDARPTGALSPAPLKMTSCIDSPRSAEAFDSPSTQRTASMTFDLPQPLGPTMPTSCPGVAIVAGSTNDLNPASLISVRRNSKVFWKRNWLAARGLAADEENKHSQRANPAIRGPIIADPSAATAPAQRGARRSDHSSVDD